MLVNISGLGTWDFHVEEDNKSTKSKKRNTRAWLNSSQKQTAEAALVQSRAYFRNQFQACLEIIVILIRIKIQTIKGDKYLKAFGLEINLEQSKESHVIKPTVVG